MNKFKRVLCIILCLLMSLSQISCGRALSAFPEEDTEECSDDSSEYVANWSIYVYMVGSDLEDADVNELSKLTTLMTQDEAKNEKEGYDALTAQRVRDFTQEVSDMGMTLPNVLYNRADDKPKSETVVDPDAMGFGTYNIESLLNSGIPDGMQFIIQTGGARRWQTPLVNPNRSQRFILDGYGMDILTDEPVKNMADPATLEEFLVFCKEYFPAEHEMVLFWDHGGGYTGFGTDQIYGTDTLTVREMAMAMANVQKLYSPYEPLFDCIGFDACLMGNLETLRLFRDYADYCIASPEIVAGVGWGYYDLVQAIAENPDITVEELGIAAAKGNVANVQLADFDGVYPAIFALYDMHKIEAVYDAYSAFAKSALKASLEDIRNLTSLAAAATDTLSYALGSTGGYNLLDLGLFADNFSSQFPQEAKAIKDALAECVLFTDSTSYFRGAGGLSVFFPTRMTGTTSLRRFLTYTLEVSDNPDIDALNYYKIVGGLNEQLLNYVFDQGFESVEFIDFYPLGDIPYLDCDISGDGNFSMCIPDDIRALVQSASFGLAYMDGETLDLAYFGEVKNLEIAPDGTVSTDFDLTMPSLGINELPVETIGETADTVTYRVPIVWFDTDCYMMLSLDKATREYTIHGFTVGQDNGTGTADRSVIEFEDGDIFYVKYKTGNLFSNVEGVGYGEYIYSKDMKVVDKPLADGCYYEYIRFDDLRSDTYYSPMICFVVEDGAVVDQYLDLSVNGLDRGTKE